MSQEKDENSQDIVVSARPDHKDERPPYKLNVQGVVIESRSPMIVAREAIKLAGFDPDTGWTIVLKVAGAPKEVIDLNTVIDLRRAGVEKLRLTPKQIDNGEAQKPRRFDFELLEKDVRHLNVIGARWETAIDGGRRWLLLRQYLLPPGYTVDATDIAIEVPVSYPGAQLDMFYCHPRLVRQSGQPIPQTDTIEAIFGTGFQRWSRHRPANTWNSAIDCVSTQLALVDAALAREVE